MPDTPGPGPLPYDPPKWDGIDHGQQPQVWENPVFVPGRMGINPAVQLTQLQPEEAAERVNLIQRRDGGLQVRPGQTVLASGAGAVNVLAVEELNDPGANSFVRFAAAGTTLWRGTGAGIFTALEAGFSGNPLTFLPFRPRLSGSTYMLVADSSKMRQVPFAGAPFPLGLPAPAVAAAPEVADILTTGIAAFDSSDATQAANWTMNAGTTRPEGEETPKSSDPPTAADVTGLSGSAVEFTLVPGAVDAAYYSFMGLAKAIDLTTLQAGVKEASDLDIIHFWLRCDRPDRLEEIRVYLVCSPGFDPTIVPGTDELLNTDAFVKAIRPHDFTNFVELLQGALGAGRDSRDNDITEDYLSNPPEHGPPTTQELLDAVDPYDPGGSDQLPTQTTPQLVPGRAAWSEFGNIGRPLRRGEFLRIGGQTDRGWNTITGLIIVIQTNTTEAVKVACDDWFLTGGYNLDSSEATASPYDYRYTNYHTVTGDEGNPSPEQTPDTFVESLRRRLKATPPPYGDSAVRQRFYRRGGSLVDDWYYVGENASDGGEFVDDISDAEASAADTLEIDNYQPVPTVNSAGTTVLAQPLPFVFEINGQLFGGGDSYRPGHLYRSKVGRPGSWPADFVQEVCPPSEELMHGTAIGGGGILWSRQRLFSVQANLTQNGDASVTEIPGPGLAQRWAWCERDGVIYYVAADGIYRTAGGAAEPIFPKLRPLFESQESTVNPLYPPIDWDAGDYTLDLEVYQNRLYFAYLDTGGVARLLVGDLLTQEIGEFQFANTLATVHADRGMLGVRPETLLLGGLGNGTLYTWSGFTDAGTAIPFRVSTGYLDGGRPREDKHLGDAIVEADIVGQLDFQIKLNNGDVTNSLMSVTGTGGRQRFTFDPFGIIPQFARNLQVTLSGTAPTTSSPVLYQLGLSYASLPDQTMKRATQFQPLGVSEQFVKGCTLVCDTGDQAITILAEGTRTGLGDPFTMGTLTVQAKGKRLLQFSWATARAEQVRLRPITDCGPWRLFSVQWDHTPEPPRVGYWDTHAEQLGDGYFTGVDLDVNTFGATKQVLVEIDGTLVTNQATGTTIFTLPAVNGRRWQHLTFNAQTPIRGHVARIYSTDGVLGMLFAWKWHAEPEPPEQFNWNQNYSIEAAMNDKAIKGIKLECDTFGQTKSLRIEVDQTLLTTKTVNVTGRSVRYLTWPQGVGRVVRIYPTDAFPGRLYSWDWIFDEEPLCLDRWETQRIDFGVGGRKSIYHLETAYKSAYTVTLEVQVYNLAGLLVQSLAYILPPTVGSDKSIEHVQFDANAGWLYKFIWTVPDPTGFWLYRPETRLTVLPWGGEMMEVNPFGDDDLDKVRSLSRSKDIASTSGGVRA